MHVVGNGRMLASGLCGLPHRVLVMMPRSRMLAWAGVELRLHIGARDDATANHMQVLIRRSIL